MTKREETKNLFVPIGIAIGVLLLTSSGITGMAGGGGCSMEVEEGDDGVSETLFSATNVDDELADADCDNLILDATTHWLAPMDRGDTVTASSTFPFDTISYEASNLLDGIKTDQAGTYWLANDGEENVQLHVTLGTSRHVDMINLYNGQHNGDYGIEDFSLEVSSDGENYTLIKQGTLTSIVDSANSININEVISHIRITAESYLNGGAGLAEIEILPDLGRNLYTAKLISSCSDTQYETKAPTLTSDRVCQDQPSCAAWEIVAVPGTTTTPQTCKAKCAVNEWYDDGECKTVSECNDNEVENTAPTQTSDRSCRDMQVQECGNRGMCEGLGFPKTNSSGRQLSCEDFEATTECAEQCSMVRNFGMRDVSMFGDDPSYLEHLAERYNCGPAESSSSDTAPTTDVSILGDECYKRGICGDGGMKMGSRSAYECTDAASWGGPSDCFSQCSRGKSEVASCLTMEPWTECLGSTNAQRSQLCYQ